MNKRVKISREVLRMCSKIARCSPSLHVPIERSSGYAQKTSSFRLAPARPTESLLTDGAPEFIGNIVEGSVSREPNFMRPSIPAPVLQRHAKIEGTPIPEHQGPFENISKLSDISRPMVLRQGFDCDGIEHRQV